MTLKRSFVFLATWLGVSVGAAAQSGPGPKQSPDYGTQKVTYYRMAASEFSLKNGESNATGLNFDRYSVPFAASFRASPHLPDGALLVSVELDYCDTSATVDTSLIVYDMAWDGSSLVPLDIQDSGSGQMGCNDILHDVSGSHYAVDNNFHQLVFEVGTLGTAQTSFVGVIVGYKLQVSPDPPGATFTDVPTNHPFHRFVEALYKAGITGGYPDGRFGVDDPITRGQMAVFLATALGLQFP